MTGMAAAIGGIEKLLRVARGNVEALRQDLVDIERAREAALKALAALDHRLEKEQSIGGDPVAFAHFVEGARYRRQKIRATLTTLDKAEMHARENLHEAFLEVKKLEHLVAANKAVERRRLARREAATNDDLAAIARKC